MVEALLDYKGWAFESEPIINGVRVIATKTIDGKRYFYLEEGSNKDELIGRVKYEIDNFNNG